MEVSQRQVIRTLGAKSWVLDRIVLLLSEVYKGAVYAERAVDD
jgi:hypothetical protein